MSIVKRFLYRVNLWIKASRASFFSGSIIPVLLGSVLAWYDVSCFLWLNFWLTLIGTVLIHAGTNMANDYFDHIYGCDEANPNPTKFSGGSRMIQNGLIAPKKILYASLITLSIGICIGLYLNFVSGRNIILILGIIGIFLAIFYTANPFKIAYNTLGELAVGIAFGPLIVMGSYYVQAQNLSIREFLVSLPIGILIALILYINEFPDFEGDKKVGKRTLVVLLGKKNAIALYHFSLFFTYLVIILLIAFSFLPYICLIVLISLPISIKAFIVSKRNFDKIYELLPANAYTVKLHSFIGSLLCLGIILDKVFK